MTVADRVLAADRLDRVPTTLEDWLDPPPTTLTGRLGG